MGRPRLLILRLWGGERDVLWTGSPTQKPGRLWEMRANMATEETEDAHWMLDQRRGNEAGITGLLQPLSMHRAATGRRYPWTMPSED